MDTTLVAVTALAVAMAIAMGVMLARMMREERRRSDARVALLAEVAAEPAASAPVHAHASDLFHVEPEPSPWPQRFAVIAAMTVVLGIAVVVMKSAIGTPAPAARPSAAAPASASPLELLSLRHAQENGTLTITGLVQNPRTSGQVHGVEATVLVFDGGGAMLTSGRAPLDFTTLGAGDESPFVIRIPVQGAVARYRVGFRGADGRVLGHVDRRNSESIAQRQDP